MSDRDEYVQVRGKLAVIRKDAVLFAVGDSVSRGEWIPRTTVHGADDLTITGMEGRLPRGGHPMTLRIRRWKAEEAGFEGTQDTETADLFIGGNYDCR